MGARVVAVLTGAGGAPDVIEAGVEDSGKTLDLNPVGIIAWRKLPAPACVRAPAARVMIRDGYSRCGSRSGRRISCKCRLSRRRNRRKRICNRRRWRIPNGRRLSSCAKGVYTRALRYRVPETDWGRFCTPHPLGGAAILRASSAQIYGRTSAQTDCGCTR